MSDATPSSNLRSAPVDPEALRPIFEQYEGPCTDLTRAGHRYAHTAVQGRWEVFRAAWDRAVMHCRAVETTAPQAIPARPYPGDEEAIRQYGKSFACRCVARRSDDNHRDDCEFWLGVLAARKQWMDRNVVAWSCSEEAAGHKRCSQWCGHPQFCTATGTDRRKAVNGRPSGE